MPLIVAAPSAVNWVKCVQGVHHWNQVTRQFMDSSLSKPVIHRTHRVKTGKHCLLNSFEVFLVIGLSEGLWIDLVISGCSLLAKAFYVIWSSLNILKFNILNDFDLEKHYKVLKNLISLNLDFRSFFFDSALETKGVLNLNFWSKKSLIQT